MQVNQFHLTYCTNIHPGESWDAIWHNLQQYLPQLKRLLCPEKSFGIGLRLSNEASVTLLEGDRLAQLKDWLAAENLYIFTLNGFPYGGFHHQVVKDQVYAPDWYSLDRLDYTRRLIQILAAVLPADMEGSISTLPISYKPWWQSSTQLELNNIHAAKQLAILAEELAQHYQETGQLIHLGLEPEPDGLIENTQEVIDWFEKFLFPIGIQHLQHTKQCAAHISQAALRRHIQVCYDTCHFAVEFEDPIAALEQFTAANIGISKVQLSSALQIDIPKHQHERQALLDKLQPFAESTYLHQVKARKANGEYEQYRDLSIALKDWLPTDAVEWRTHFHVPLFIPDYPPLSSTQQDIQLVLQYLQHNPICQHLEIETYTWEVLPTDMKLDIVTSIEREYRWILAQLA
jgi:uncharacterized protein YgfB (UPF0149 family)